MERVSPEAFPDDIKEELIFWNAGSFKAAFCKRIQTDHRYAL